MWFLTRSSQGEAEVKDEKRVILERLKLGEWLPPGVTPPDTHTSWNKLVMVPVAGVILLIALALWLPFHISHNGHGQKSNSPPGKAATNNGTGGTQAENQAASYSAKPGSSQNSSSQLASNTNTPSSSENNNARLVSSTFGNDGTTAMSTGSETTPPVNKATPQPTSDSTSKFGPSGLAGLPTASVTVPALSVGILGQPLLATPPIGLQL